MEERFLRTGEAVSPERPKRELSPTTSMIVRGLGRLAAFVAIAVSVCVGTALLIGMWTDSDLWRAATLGLYVGGAILIAVPLLSWGGRSYSTGAYEAYEIELDAAARRRRQGELWVYVLIGLALVGLGVLLEVLRS